MVSHEELQQAAKVLVSSNQRATDEEVSAYFELVKQLELPDFEDRARAEKERNSLAWQEALGEARRKIGI